MAFSSLAKFIRLLEKENELIRISHPVDYNLEIAEITDRVSKMHSGGKALLFENNGTGFPVVTNILGSVRRMCLALNVEDLEEVGDEVESLFQLMIEPKKSFLDKLKLLPTLKKVSSWMPKVIAGRGACQEIIQDNPDLSIFPILKCWPNDGGQFITLPMVNTKDPNTGIRNVGMYRLQMFDGKSTGMHWHKHKVGARHYREYKKLGKTMPVAIALGGDPVYTYTATAPLPDNVDEYMLAGFLRKKHVELVSCITQDIEVPADADIIIEGYIDPTEDLAWEGPFGDHTGFYSLADWYPRLHITCITHRKNAIYPATIVGVPPQEDAAIAKATERIFLPLIRLSMLPELIDMEIPQEGVAHNLTIVSIDKQFEAHALKVMNALWGAGQMMLNKTLIVADANFYLSNYIKLAQVVTKNTDPKSDILFSRGAIDVLDHAARKFSFSGKMCIDATKKFDAEINNLPTKYIPTYVNGTEIENTFAEITKVNSSLISSDISLILIAMKKTKPTHAKDIVQELQKHAEYKYIKFYVFVDEMVDVDDVATTTWICANNIDPLHDCTIVESMDVSALVIDGTRKTAEVDKFARDWPNIVVSADATIKKVDEMWAELGIGSMQPSPSLRFKQYLFGLNASVDAT